MEKEDKLETDVTTFGSANLIVGQIFELYNLMNIDEKKDLEKIMKKKEKKTNQGEGRKDNFIKKKDKPKYKRLMEY